MAKLKLPENNKAGVGYDGKFYPAKKGCVVVPDEAAAELIAHGLAAESEDDIPSDDTGIEDAIAAVNAAGDVEALDKLADGEERTAVIAAIEARRAELTAKA